MGIYWKPNVAVGTFRYFTSKAAAAKWTQRSASSMCFNDKAKYFNGFPSSRSVNLPKLGFSSVSSLCNHDRYNPFRGGSKRFYSFEILAHIQNFSVAQWCSVASVSFLGAAVIKVYTLVTDTVMCTKRTRLLPITIDVERMIFQHRFEQTKEEFKEKILPASHPQSVRVCLLAQKIIDSLERGLGIEEKIWTDVRYTSNDADNSVWIEMNKNQFKKEKKSITSCFEGLNWEVVVVEKPDVDCTFFPGGKFLFFTGSLDHFETDEDISHYLAVAVGHMVARHPAEVAVKRHWSKMLPLRLQERFFNAQYFDVLSQKHEIEADSISLLLLAGAGYDPQVALKALDKLVKWVYESGSFGSSVVAMKRAKLMAKGEFMKKATEVYKEGLEGRHVKGFLL